MDLTNWVIILAVALISLTFFCSRAPARWSIENRARRFTGTRLLAQAVLMRGDYSEGRFMVIAPELNTPVQAAFDGEQSTSRAAAVGKP